MKSPDSLDVFYLAIDEVIGGLVPTAVLHGRSGDQQWFMPAAEDAKQTAYCAWCRARSVDPWSLFVLARAETQRVYAATIESHNERTRNTLKHSTCSHKFCETLKGSIFGVKPSIPGLRSPDVVWWQLLLRKRHFWSLSLTVSSVVSSLQLLCLFPSVQVQFFGLPDSCPSVSAS